MTKRHDISYMAGIIDGEGCISINYARKSGEYRMRISITNTDRILLDWVQERYGGYIYERKKQMPHYKRKYEWCIFAHRPQRKFIEALAETLIIKRDRALIGLEFLNLVGQRGEEVRKKREQIYLSISKLNSGRARD